MDDARAFIEARLAEDEALWQASMDWGNPTARLHAPKMLRQVAALRKIMEYAAQNHKDNPYSGFKAVLNMLASIWSDHEDYRKEWAA